jgi:hypothetical protein
VTIAKEVVLGDLHRLKSHRGFDASADVVAHSNGAIVDLELVGGVPFRMDRVACLSFVLKPSAPSRSLRSWNSLLLRVNFADAPADFEG